MAWYKLTFRNPVTYVLAFAIGAFLVEATKDTATSVTSAAPRKAGEGDVIASAKALCRRAVPQSLNDPSSVEFVDSDTWRVTNKKDHQYVVRLGLRAKNAFNATVYSEFDCYVEDRGTDWIATKAVQVSP